MFHEMTNIVAADETPKPTETRLLYDPDHPILQELPQVQARLSKLNKGVVSLALDPHARMAAEAAALERRRARDAALEDALAAAE